MSVPSRPDRKDPLPSERVRVLLVCTGNICRSPIAHGLLLDRSARSLEGGIEVRSAGTWARGGSPATREGVAAARELGLDIGAHRATPFARELAEWADLIVTMTAEQSEEVAEVIADAAAKTFTLKELVALLESLPDPAAGLGRDELLGRLKEADSARAEGRAAPLSDTDVSDPLGLSETVYRAVAHELEGLIDRLVTGLAGRL